MSDVALAQSPVFLPQGLVLPPNAEPQFAFEMTNTLAGVQGSSDATVYTSDGAYYDVITLVTCEVDTTGTAGNRFMVLQIAQLGGSTFYSIPAPLAQVAAYNGFYTWTATASTAWGSDTGSGGLYQVMPLPPLLMYPNYSVEVLNRGHKTLDAIGPITYTVIRIPNGPISDASDSLVSTPLVL